VFVLEETPTVFEKFDVSILRRGVKITVMDEAQTHAPYVHKINQ
jgi:hypothetical protein